MATPNAAQLKQYATELTALARTQRGNADQCDVLLAAAGKLTNTKTWSGTFPDETNTRVTGWLKGLTDSAGEMRAESKRWDAAAAEAEEAANQPAPAK